MKTVLKKTIQFLSFGVAFVLLMALALYLYVRSHRTQLLTKVKQQYASEFGGTINIGAIDAEYLKQFPNLNFVLKKVSIRDDHWHLHHKDLLTADKIYVQIRIAPLLLGKFQIRKFIFCNGILNIIDDGPLLSNNNILNDNTTNNKKGRKIRKIEFENFEFRYRNKLKNKDIALETNFLVCHIDKKDSLINLLINGTVQIQQLCFNTQKGSFLKNKKVKLNIAGQYLKSKNELKFEKQNLNISGQRIALSAFFYLNKYKPYFSLKINASTLNYKESLSWMSPNIRRPLENIAIEKPFPIQVNLEGKMTGQPNPHVEVYSTIKDNCLLSKFGKFENVTTKIAYNNGNVKDSSYGDKSSSILLLGLKASFKNIQFSADSSFVYNLSVPVISTQIKANFDINKLNNLIGKRSFYFEKGFAQINLVYKGCIAINKDSISDIDGNILITDADFKYLPRQLNFRKCKLHIALNNQDIELKEGTINTKNSSIRLSAMAKDFLSLYLKQPEKVCFKAAVFSNKIDLNEFETFISKRNVGTKETTTKKNDLPDAIDKVLDLSRTEISLKVDELLYRKFKAQKIGAQVNLLPKGISIPSAQLLFAGGAINLSGSLQESANNYNHFQVQSTINNVAIDSLLYSFGSFGQNSLLPENIRGKIGIKSNLSGYFDDSSRLLAKSITGHCHFEIQQGELINFKPLMRLGKHIFKKKRLENIQFGHLSNTLSIKSQAIQIPPMLIQSNLLNLQVAGIFNLDKGTDLNIRIPIFEHSKEELVCFEAQKQKGFWMNIQAKENDNGQLKYYWNIQNKEIAAARAEAKKAKQKRKKDNPKQRKP